MNRDRCLRAALFVPLLAAVVGASGPAVEPAPAAEEAATVPSFEELDALYKQDRYAEVQAGVLRALAAATISPVEEKPAVERLQRLLILSSYQGGGELTPENFALCDRIVEQAEAVFGPDDLRFARLLRQRANLYIYEGRFLEARPRLERVLELQERILGPRHPDVGATLSRMSWLMHLMGNDAQAFLVARRLQDLWEAQPEATGREQLARTLADMVLLYREAGDYTGAREAADRSVKLSLDQYGSDESHVAYSLDALSLVLRDMKEFARAREASERAARIYEKTDGVESTTYMEALTGLALAQSGLGEHAQAIATAERAVGFGEKLGRQFDRQQTIQLQALAQVLTSAGRTSGARDVYRRLVLLQEQSYGPSSPRLASPLSELARVEYELGELAESSDHALRAEAIARRHFLDLAQLLSERQALTYEEIRASGTQVLLSILAQAGGGRGTGRGPAGAGRPVANPAEVWDEVVRSRGLVLDEMGFRHRLLRSTGNSEVDALTASLSRARERLSAALVRGVGSSSASEFGAEVASRDDEKERLERALAEKSSAFRGRMTASRTGLQDVAAALPGDAALVAFLRFHPLAAPRARPTAGGPDAPSYAAFVLRPGARGPVFVSLGPAAPIDEAIRRWREAVGSPMPGLPAHSGRWEDRYRAIARPVHDAIWRPLAGSLTGARRVFIVPDGAIHLVNFGTLPADGGRYLVETGPLLHYLSTERDLVRHPARPVAGSRLLALGAPDFDAAPRATGPVFRGVLPSCSAAGALRFDALPGAFGEIGDIDALWSARRGIAEPAGAVRTLVGAEATESAFKQLAPGFDVVHVATHGLFLQDRCASAFPSAVGDTAGHGDNPMTLSGLAFAGANQRAAAPADADDGVLTAEEIAMLDLSGVSWVVLSACETGVGVVQDGEGILGLRRAFEVAGAGTLIMSLWKVEDDWTRAWMHGLYEGRLSGLTTAEAARGASTGIIESRRRVGRSTHPFFWGGFVAAGDWR